MSHTGESIEKFKKLYAQLPAEDKPSLWINIAIAPAMMFIALVWAFGWPAVLFCFGYLLRFATYPKS